MALAPGTRLGPYEVTAQIGVGGMGEVYQATDTNLQRSVAIKVLPDAVAADAERLARFQREAEVLARLNHPNIAQIYGLERSGGTTALVMELVDGPTLADRIAEGPIPVDTALPIARQMADALEAAHEQGIVHRDLKPANVKVRADGTVKVLDFGLAKAMEPSGAKLPGVTQSPTITTPAHLRDGYGGQAMTQVGMILGTAAYMSPEQARGKSVDKRADIWAFGCVLFEMLSGGRAFEDEDVSLTLSRVLQREPDLGSLPAAVPARVRQALAVCLRKDPRQRAGDIHDVWLALDGAFETTPAGPSAAAGVSALHRWQRPVPLAIAAAGLALGGLAVFGLTRPAAEPRPVSRFSLALGADQRFSFTGRHAVAISPDGATIAYVAQNSLWLRPLDQLQATLVRGTEAEARSPFFSPDGQWVGFFAGTQLKKVPVGGGASVALCEATNPYGASWGEDDAVLFGQPDGIWQVAGSGGRAVRVIATEPGERAHGPQRLPGGDWVLFTLRPGSTTEWDEAQIVVQSLATGAREVVIDGGRDARYLPTGHLVYGQGGVVFAVPFDRTSRRVTGWPVSLVEGVTTAATAVGAGTGAMQFAVAGSGTLAYIPGAVLEGERPLLWVTSDGREERLAVPLRAFTALSLSPDGTRAALEIADASQDVWVAELSRGSLMRLTVDPGIDGNPLWSPDGDRIVFASDRSGREELYARAADGSGVDERVSTFDGTVRVFPSGWAPDGRLLVQLERSGGSDVGLLAVDGSGKLDLLLQAGSDERMPAVSPDGRWLAYTSNETGFFEVYVQRFPMLGDKRQVSTAGITSSAPTWSNNGRALTYIEGIPQTHLVRVGVEDVDRTRGIVRFGPPERAGFLLPRSPGRVSHLRRLAAGRPLPLYGNLRRGGRSRRDYRGLELGRGAQGTRPDEVSGGTARLWGLSSAIRASGCHIRPGRCRGRRCARAGG